MPPAPQGTISASSGDPLPENVGELLKAFEAGETAEAEAVVEAPPSPENPPESPAAESEPPKAAEPVRKALAEFTEEELLADARVTGRLGTLLQKQLKKALADTTAQQARLAKQQADDALMNQNPQQYVQQVQRERVQNQNLAALYDQVYTPLRTDFSELPSEVQSELSTKSYEHLSPADSAVAYLRDRNAAVVKYEVAKQLATVVKEAREAERKKVLTEQNGGSPRPDTGTTAGSPRKTFTPDAVERMDPMGDYRALGRTPKERVDTVFGGARSR